MTAEVVIVQHGEKAPGPGDPGLTAAGVAQARAAVAALVPLAPALIAASPLRRARETAAPLLAATGLPLVIDPRLRERANLEPGDDPARFFADWARSTAERDWTPPGGRSSERTGADLLAGVEDLAMEGRLVVLFGHGGATVDLLRTLLGDAELEHRAPGFIDTGPAGGARTRLVRTQDCRWTVTGIG